MSIDAPKDRLELHNENLNRLKVLMGDDYNAMEMEDHLSYFDPEYCKKEIDTFEYKLLKTRNIPRSDLIEKFKAHLGYLVA